MKTLVAFFIVIACSGYAFAEGPCKADLEKFCSQVEPGHGARMKCLKEHESELSPECKAHKEQLKELFKEKRKNFKEACQEDIQKFCSDVKPGKKAVIKCLKANEEKLSQECRDLKPAKN